MNSNIVLPTLWDGQRVTSWYTRHKRKGNIQAGKDRKHTLQLQIHSWSYALFFHKLLYKGLGRLMARTVQIFEPHHLVHCAPTPMVRNRILIHYDIVLFNSPLEMWFPRLQISSCLEKNISVLHDSGKSWILLRLTASSVVMSLKIARKAYTQS